MNFENYDLGERYFIISGRDANKIFNEITKKRNKLNGNKKDGKFIVYIPIGEITKYNKIMDEIAEGNVAKIDLRITGGLYKIYDKKEKDFKKEA